MRIPILDLVEGQTLPLDFGLKGLVFGATGYTYVDLTGSTVSTVLRDAAGTIVKDTTAGVSVTSSTGGLVRYEPTSSSGDLFVAAQSPYTIRFRLTDSQSNVDYFPRDEADLILVRVS